MKKNKTNIDEIIESKQAPGGHTWKGRTFNNRGTKPVTFNSKQKFKKYLKDNRMAEV